MRGSDRSVWRVCPRCIVQWDETQRERDACRSCWEKHTSPHKNPIKVTYFTISYPVFVNSRYESRSVTKVVYMYV